MVIKKISPPSHSLHRSMRDGIISLLRYIRNEAQNNHNEKVTYANALNLLAETPEGQAAEMAALASETVHSKIPVAHWMMSWQAGEQPTNAQVDQAVEIFLEQTGLQGHQVIYALHDNTENVHLHIAVNRVNPETLKVTRINNGFDKETAHRSIAKIEAEQMWNTENNTLYKYIDGEFERQKTASKQKSIPSKASDYEVITGNASDVRSGQELGVTIIRSSISWGELHSRLLQIGMRFEAKGSGAVIYIGETAIKASSLHRDCSLAKLIKKLGAYAPRNETNTKGQDNDGTKRTAGRISARRAGRSKRTRNRGGSKITAQGLGNSHKQNTYIPSRRAGQYLLNLSQCRLAYLGKSEQEREDQNKNSRLLHDNACSSGREFGGMRRYRNGRRVNRAGKLVIDNTNDNNNTINPRFEAEEYRKYRENRKEKQKKYSSVRNNLKISHKQELSNLAEQQKKQRKVQLSGNWRGKGHLLNALRSIIAFEQASERQRVKIRQKQELEQLRAEAKVDMGNYIATIEEWVKLRNPQHAKLYPYSKCTQCTITDGKDTEIEEITETTETIHEQQHKIVIIGITEFKYYKISPNGYVYYSLSENDAPKFVDTGPKILLYEDRDPQSILAAMQLAAKKWNRILIHGTQEYKEHCVRIAAKHGISIVNPEIKELIHKETAKLYGDTAMINKTTLNFNAYHDAVNADRYRVTCIRMYSDGNKKTFILDKINGETKGFTPEELRKHIPEMLRLQAKGENIYLTPLSENKHHILIDDMNKDKLDELINVGIKPAVIIESSQASFQAVITISKLQSGFDREAANRVTEKLNQLYGDKNLSGCIHPHRTPGFQNLKPKHRTPAGTYPTVRLLESYRRECDTTFKIYKEINEQLQKLASERRNAPKKEKSYAPTGSPEAAYYRHLDNIQEHLSVTDNSRVDAMIALRMRATGHNRDEVAETLAACASTWRGKQENRNWERYAERTADYAFGLAGDRDLQRWEAYIDLWRLVESGESQIKKQKNRMR
jgi:hypothetical protein